MTYSPKQRSSTTCKRGQILFTNAISKSQDESLLKPEELVLGLAAFSTVKPVFELFKKALRPPDMSYRCQKGIFGKSMVRMFYNALQSREAARCPWVAHTRFSKECFWYQDMVRIFRLL